MIWFLKNIQLPILLLILLSGMGGCIYEDNSECITGLYIYFSPENPKHKYPELVQTVNLYFYDKTGKLAASFFYNKEELYSADRVAIVDDMSEGEYTLVSIINNIESYYTEDEQRLENLQSYLKDKIIEYPLVDFFSGITEITVKRSTTQQKVIADIFKHNNDIRVEIIFDGYEPPPRTTFNMYIDGNNGAYHYYSGTCPENNLIKYLPHQIEKDQNCIPIVAAFTIMRLWRNADITLYLQEENPIQGVIRTIQLNIADELAKVVNHQNEFLYDTDAKLSFNDEYKIVITLSADFIILKLDINDWTIIGGGIDV